MLAPCLTKRIEVVGIEDLVETMDDKTLALDSIGLTKATTSSKGRKTKGVPVATLKLSVKVGSIFEVKNIELKQNSNLLTKTKNEAYADGYTVTEISAKKDNEYIKFENGKVLYLKQSTAALLKEELFRILIRETIRIHFDKQRKLINQGIKVLSLFFIDRVANYQPNESIIRIIFEEEFVRVQNESKSNKSDDLLHGDISFLEDVNPTLVHKGVLSANLRNF